MNQNKCFSGLTTACPPQDRQNSQMEETLISLESALETLGNELVYLIDQLIPITRPPEPSNSKDIALNQVEQMEQSPPRESSFGIHVYRIEQVTRSIKFRLNIIADLRKRLQV